MKKFKEFINKWKALLAIAVILIGMVGIHLPYYMEGPGEATDLSKIVQVEGMSAEHEGGFYWTTVKIVEGTPLTYLLSHLPYHDWIRSDEMYGDWNPENYKKLQAFYMESSKTLATYVAYKEAGKEVQLVLDGIYVAEVRSRIPLKTGDLIQKLNGEQIISQENLTEKISSLKIGEEIELTVLREGELVDVHGFTVAHPQTGLPALGVVIVPQQHIEATILPQFNTKDTTGPSAGFMLTLELYQRVSGNSLTKGRKIAGTGTIDSNGKVGQIGGIDKKVVAASRAGCQIFFAPDGESTDGQENNYQEAIRTAEKIHSSMIVIPVKEFRDALSYLEQDGL